MGRKLPLWCRNAKHAMIDKNIGTGEIAGALGYTPQYVSSIINGRVYAAAAVKRISYFLGVDSDYNATDEGRE